LFSEPHSFPQGLCGLFIPDIARQILLDLLCLKLVLLQALKEAFEVFCNKGVAGSSSAELLATFCDNILKKGGSEKLSDEAIEETLEKVCCAAFAWFCCSCYYLTS